MSLTVEAVTQGFDVFVDQARARVPEILLAFKEEGSQIALEQIRYNSPIRTGFLQESWRVSFHPQGFVLQSSAPYAQFVDQGTRPHIIFPNKARVLRWESPEGVPHYAKRVAHPGFVGRHFIQHTVDFLSVELPRLAKEIVERVLNG